MKSLSALSISSSQELQNHPIFSILTNRIHDLEEENDKLKKWKEINSGYTQKLHDYLHAQGKIECTRNKVTYICPELSRFLFQSDDEEATHSSSS